MEAPLLATVQRLITPNQHRVGHSLNKHNTQEDQQLFDSTVRKQTLTPTQGAHGIGSEARF